MVLTRFEKVAFVTLMALLGMGIFLLIGKLGLANQKNQELRIKIANIAALTEKNVLVKDDTIFKTNENKRKLNLNRANLMSIELIPEITSLMAERIYNFIKKRGSIKSLSELSEVKGVTKRKMRSLQQHATTWGGHAGQAAWGEKLDLNFASEEELKALPGIGKKSARDLIDFRNRNGGFFSLEDIKEVPGFTENKIKKFIDKVEVR
jgi:competence ComEA-like helix-hairpin-helix protein